MLEIRVNERWLEDNKKVLRQSQNFQMLKYLLRDPYLDKGVLLAGQLLDEWDCWDYDSYVDVSTELMKCTQKKV